MKNGIKLIIYFIKKLYKMGKYLQNIRGRNKGLPNFNLSCIINTRVVAIP